jgi:type IV pilus biogenesis protein CpaD/CtpE
MPAMRAPVALVLAAFLALFLAGCAGEVPVPFLNAALPPAPPGPAPEYPSIAPPVVEGTRIPIMTQAEREAVEAQLKKLVEEREGTVKKKIDKSN